MLISLYHNKITYSQGREQLNQENIEADKNQENHLHIFFPSDVPRGFSWSKEGWLADSL